MEFKISRDELKVDWDWVRTELIRLERISKDAVLKSSDSSIEKAKALVTPAMVCAEKTIEKISAGSVILKGRTVIASKFLAGHIKGAKAVNIFAVTIGERLEREASRLMDSGDQLGGYLLDRIGSVAVESLAEKTEGFFRKEYAARNLSVSARFSPGYCDWPVEDQAKLDKLLGFSRAGITLTESFMMVPRKSISALVGIGPADTFSANGSPCKICDKDDCSYRRNDY